MVRHPRNICVYCHMLKKVRVSRSEIKRVSQSEIIFFYILKKENFLFFITELTFLHLKSDI